MTWKGCKQNSWSSPIMSFTQDSDLYSPVGENNLSFGSFGKRLCRWKKPLLTIEVSTCKPFNLSRNFTGRSFKKPLYEGRLNYPIKQGKEGRIRSFPSLLEWSWPALSPHISFSYFHINYLRRLIHDFLKSFFIQKCSFDNPMCNVWFGRKNPCKVHLSFL